MIMDNRNDYQKNYSYGKRYAEYNDADNSSYDENYEAERNSTSDERRNQLMQSLNASSQRKSIIRNYVRYEADNNFDRMFDKKQNANAPKEKQVFNKKKLPFVITYIVLAFISVLAISFSISNIGVKSTATFAKKDVATLASAEENGNNETVIEDTAEVMEETPVVEETPVIGGENYIMLSNGEVIAVEIPNIVEDTKEEESGFDSFCSWLNNVFGG